MREITIETYLVKGVKAMGGKCPKYKTPGNNGAPDRLLLLSGARILFVELKAPGEKPTAIQVLTHVELQALGFDVRVIDSIAGVDALLDELCLE